MVGKLWSRAQVFGKQKGECSKPIFKYYCIIMNCFTLVFNGFHCKPYFKASKQCVFKKTMVLI